MAKGKGTKGRPSGPINQHKALAMGEQPDVGSAPANGKGPRKGKK